MFALASSVIPVVADAAVTSGRWSSRSSAPADTSALVPGIVLASLCNRDCPTPIVPLTFASPLPPWRLPPSHADRTQADVRTAGTTNTTGTTASIGTATSTTPFAEVLHDVGAVPPSHGHAQEPTARDHERASLALEELLECLADREGPAIPIERRVASCAVGVALQACDEGDDAWCRATAERTLELGQRAGPTTGNRYEQRLAQRALPHVAAVDHARHLVHQRVRSLPLYTEAMEGLGRCIVAHTGDDDALTSAPWTAMALEQRVGECGNADVFQHRLRAVGLALGTAFDRQVIRMYRLQPGLLDAAGRSAMDKWRARHLPADAAASLTPVQSRHLWNELAHWLNQHRPDTRR